MTNRHDISSFDQIVREYQSMVFRTALGFVHVREDAEDLTQEVFLRAYRARESFRGESEISTWLYRITVNLSLNHVNRKNRKGFIEIGEQVLKNIFNRDSGERDPHQILERAQKDEAIRDAIDSLPDKQRTAFILSKYDDLPQREIAGIMSITEGAVEQLLVRAKTNLQKKLDRSIGKNE